MPGKKKGAASGGGTKPKITLFGKPDSSNLSMGLVGLPSAGKSLTFNILTKLDQLVAEHPFATIDPFKATVAVPDSRFDWLVEKYKPKSEVPATLSVTDIAGLIKGASKGDGLGNDFLSHIQSVNGIYHVVRGFPSERIPHVMGGLDAVRDLEVIKRELLLKDLQYVASYLSKNRRNASMGRGGRSALLEFQSVDKCYRWLRYGDVEGGPVDEGAAAGGGGGGGVGVSISAKGPESIEIEDDEPLGKEVRFGPWSADDVDAINPLNLITAKPAIYLVNLSPKQYSTKKAKCLLEVKEWLDARGYGEKLIPFCAQFEAQLMAAEDPKEKEALVKEVGKSALSKIIKEGFKALNLINFFTAGEDEVRAWNLRKGSLAPKAAGAIHSDMENGFICAEIHHYDDLVEFETEAKVKAAGKHRTEGKSYEVKDGDICFFKFSPPKGGKK